MADIYCVNLSENIEVQGKYGKTLASHQHVVAGSFEAALAATREAYPGCSIRGVSMLNYQNGLPVIYGEGAE